MILKEFINSALREDCPHVDVTTQALDIFQKMGSARLLAKEDIILSGRELFTQTVLHLDPKAQVQWSFEDGQMAYRDQVVAIIYGNLVSLLQTERVALNFLGHLSGIASLTYCFVKEVDGTQCQILDTRKTTPGYRSLEKRAVRHGGGCNHRLHLSETVLIKENHIDLAGGIYKAVQKVKEKKIHPIEVEVTSLFDAQEAVEAGATRLLLDNMSNGEMLECVRKIPAEITLEASGNMTIERVRSVADLGIHYISVGALTHSAPCADFSLQFDNYGGFDSYHNSHGSNNLSNHLYNGENSSL